MPNLFPSGSQDYHRFHSPVDGVVGPMTYIAGEYYTVNVSSLFISDYALFKPDCACSPKPSVPSSTSTEIMRAKLSQLIRQYLGV
jgi:hypothetical protein